ncbi:hypothetical protein GCM10010052_19660 [Paenarthrobacter histidinolovorans]|nr:hypothetical protein GCM10010052_19660 [Paenarthrobacter histidinolovorans]
MVSVNVYEQRVVRVIDEHRQSDTKCVGDVLTALGLKLAGTWAWKFGE